MVRIQKCKNCRKMFPIKIPIVCPKFLDLDTLPCTEKWRHNISIYLHQGQPAYFIENNSIHNCNLSTNQKARIFHQKIMQQNKSCVRNPKQTNSLASRIFALMWVFLNMPPLLVYFPQEIGAFRAESSRSWIG